MKIWSIMKRVVQQFVNDKRSLALLVVAPLFVLTLLWVVLDIEKYEPTILLTDVPDQLTDALKKEDATLETMSIDKAETALKANEADAHIRLTDGELQITMEGSNPTATKRVQQVLSQGMQTLNPKATDTEVNFLHGSDDLKAFDNSGPALVGLFVFFFVFLLSGVTFLRERTQNTLERLLATPLKRWEIVLGYLGGFGIFIVIQSVLIVLYAVYALGMYMEGSIISVLVITILLALVAQSLGTLLSAFAKNEFQMIQFIPIVIVPQVFFSGIFSTEQVDWIHVISKVMPLTYGSDALKAIMLRGQGMGDSLLEIGVLIGFFVVFLTLNITALKKHRRI
ncbi:Inner membrane transport permease [Lentibacillus sp. JNUCC-1]|nr:Inner membrane transport permease [Lentibacillus sp. JNUCC-1]